MKFRTRNVGLDCHGLRRRAGPTPEDKLDYSVGFFLIWLGIGDTADNETPIGRVHAGLPGQRRMQRQKDHGRPVNAQVEARDREKHVICTSCT